MPFLIAPYVMWSSWVMLLFTLKVHYDPRLQWLVSQHYPDVKKPLDSQQKPRLLGFGRTHK